MIRLGDIFEIHLSGGRFAYGQYLYKDRKKGHLISVFNLISNERISMESLENAGLLFPPIFTGLIAAIREGFWTVIGNIKIKNFIYPKFISTIYNEKTGEAGHWYIWDGEVTRHIGLALPKDYKNLEYLFVWSPFDVVQRIETGEYVFPYRELIEHNKFTPRKNPEEK